MMRRRPMGRAGRPGLLGTMARTAVVAGTATAVSGNVARRQQGRAMEQQQAEAYRQQQQTPPPPPAAPPAPPTPSGETTDDLITQLRELGELRSSGVLTDEEFAAQKARLLNS